LASCSTIGQSTVGKKEPHPDKGRTLKPKFSKPKTEIPNQVRDDKTQEQNPVVMNLGLMKIRLVSASDQGFSGFGS
jgi:hypothetical protein